MIKSLPILLTLSVLFLGNSFCAKSMPLEEKQTTYLSESPSFYPFFIIASETTAVPTSISIGAYTDFLNTYATQDPHGLYDQTWQGVINQIVTEHGFVYKTISAFREFPILHLTTDKAARFCNVAEYEYEVASQMRTPTEDLEERTEAGGAYSLVVEEEEPFFEPVEGAHYQLMDQRWFLKSSPASAIKNSNTALPLEKSTMPLSKNITISIQESAPTWNEVWFPALTSYSNKTASLFSDTFSDISKIFEQKTICNTSKQLGSASLQGLECTLFMVASPLLFPIAIAADCLEVLGHLLRSTNTWIISWF